MVRLSNDDIRPLTDTAVAPRRAETPGRQPASAAAPGTPSALTTGDSQQLSRGAQAAQRAGDVDIEVTFGPSGATLHGRVGVSQPEVQKLLTDALRKSPDMSGVQVTYDAAGGVYNVTGSYELNWLPDPSFSFSIKPETSNGTFLLQVSNIDTPGPQLDIIDRWVMKSIGEEARSQGLASTVDPQNRQIQLDTKSIMQREAQTTLGRIDWNRQQVSPAIGQGGNLDITLIERGRPAPGPDSDPAHTDVRVNMDAPTVKNQLNHLLNRCYSACIADVQLGQNSMRVVADVAPPEASSVIMSLFTLASGNPRVIEGYRQS